MIPDQTHLPAEVKADVEKVRKALSSALSATNDSPAHDALAALSAPIEAWAKRGTDAAATRAKVPSANGWPGWVKAGTVYLDGIEDITKEGAHYILDAITAQALDVPATAAQTVHAAAHVVKQTVIDTADAAQHAVGDLGSGLGKLFTRVALAGAALVVLLVVVRKSV